MHEQTNIMCRYIKYVCNMIFYNNFGKLDYILVNYL